MVTSVVRVGAAAALALDQLLLDLSGLKVGDAVRIQWKEDGTLVVTPLGRAATREELAASIRRIGSPADAPPGPDADPSTH